MTLGPPPLADLAAGIAAGDRALLARAITLVESRHPEHRRRAEALLQELMPLTGRARRIGVTGVPGAGKSTFIEALGCRLTAAGHRVAVLAVDPSSPRTGGSILGDKTRMARLAVDERAFIRPSPTAGALGGVGRMTRETMLLCEAAGYDMVLVETVGAGQSEVVVAGMVDFFLALMLPGAGDELQGIKKGLIELADMIAVNKADGDDRRRAELAAAHYRAALRIIAPASRGWSPPVCTVSALEGTGLDELWAEIGRHARILGANGELAARRRAQRGEWFRATLHERLLDRLRGDVRIGRLLPELERAVAEGEVAVPAAVERVLALVPGTG